MTSDTDRSDNLEIELTWQKDLSMSDAQQDTQGARMRFLRLTKADLSDDHRTWFREVFFGALEWARIGGEEEAHVILDVTICGQHLGKRTMRLDHAPRRSQNHAAPPTHLHFDHVTRAALESQDLSGHPIRLRKDGKDYFLEVL